MITPNQKTYFKADEYEQEVMDFFKVPLSVFKEIRKWFSEKDIWRGINPKQEFEHQELFILYNSLINNARWIASGIYPEYDINSHINSPARRWMQPIKDFFKPGMKLLDYGCGDLTNSICFCDMGYEVVSVDLPLEYMKFMEYRVKKFGYDIEFRWANNVNGWFAGYEEFDVIFTHEVLEHVKYPNVVLSHLTASMKKDGLMFMTANFDTGAGFHLIDNRQNWGKTKPRNSPEWVEEVKRIKLEPIGNDLYKRIV